jgi:tRNA (adenine57-N1/adenine58-N1)-methyltransferase
VYSYERNPDFAKGAAENVKRSGLENIIITNKDFSTCKEKNADVVTLDMQEPNIKKASNILKPGGWLCIFCLHMEQVQNMCKQLEDMDFTRPMIVENILRNWQCQIGSKTYTRPKTQMLGHTGFLVFSRKL